jgi:hypothetical protein
MIPEIISPHEAQCIDLHTFLHCCPAYRAGSYAKGSLYQLLQILSVTLLEKTPILRALQPFAPKMK